MSRCPRRVSVIAKRKLYSRRRSRGRPLSLDTVWSQRPNPVASLPMNEKLDVATVFERVWAIYRDQFGLLIPAAFVVFLPVAILNGIILNGGAFLELGLLAAAIGVVATFWFQGMVVEAARDIL